ncbi:MAG: branched-chain amino acid ABC transporter permease [Candidatus Izemoplasmataceae bacterium]
MKTINIIEKYLTTLSKAFKKQPLLPIVLFGLLISLAGILPHIGLMKFGTMGTLSLVVIYTVVALGLNILMGFSGLISLGTAGFVGVGALGTASLLNAGVPLEISVLIVLVIAGSVGALIGLFSLKVDGIYLAIATLFVGEILTQIFTQVESLFGPGNTVDSNPVTLFGFITLSNYPQDERSMLFILLVLFMVLAMIVMHNIVKSRTGRALMAMSRSEHAAQAMGISLIKYRLTAFITATLYATVGGILYAIYNPGVPKEGWSLGLSLFIIAMVVVGGFKSIFGTFIGAFIIYGVPNLFLKELFGDVSYIMSGVLIILVILFYPHGLVYIGYDIKKLYFKWKLHLQKKVVKSDEK